MKILLAEDEPDLASFIRRGLEEESFEVDWASDGNSAIDTACSGRYDLLLLDVRLPDISGFQVARRIRAVVDNMPIIMLTALDSVDDKVRGLESGADDYLTKPFAFEELLARISAVMRRSGSESTLEPLVSGDLRLDIDIRKCTFRNREIGLTRREFDLLATLLRQSGRPVSRDEIHRSVWGHDFDRGTNLIDVYINYVRRKLRSARCPIQIETVRGIGYRILSATRNEPEQDYT